MLTEGTLLGGRYRVGALVGRGGMADVYRATDTEAGPDVAVKVLRHVAPDQARRFAAESVTLSRLDHPAIVRFCGSGEERDTPFLVMEYVEGPTLADLLRSGPLGFERTVALGAHLAEALAYAHGLGVVHRDVKPGNVLIDREGVPRLADFGIARLSDASTLTATGTFLGTASYVAPEQLDDGRVDAAADVYSLGLVLLECTTGRRAYEGTPTEAAMARLARDPEVPDDLPVWWADLLRQMTSRGPDARPPSDDVVRDLRRAGGASTEETVELRNAGPTLRLPGAGVSSTDTAVIERKDATAELPPEAAPVASASTTGERSEGTPASGRRRPRRVGPAMVVLAVVALVVVMIVVQALAGGGDDPGQLPPQLDRSLDRLERSVSG